MLTFLMEIYLLKTIEQFTLMRVGSTQTIILETKRPSTSSEFFSYQCFVHSTFSSARVNE